MHADYDNLFVTIAEKKGITVFLFSKSDTIGHRPSAIGHRPSAI
jgi:hypothetical protein